MLATPCFEVAHAHVANAAHAFERFFKSAIYFNETTAHLLTSVPHGSGNTMLTRLDQCLLNRFGMAYNHAKLFFNFNHAHRFVPFSDLELYCTRAQLNKKNEKKDETGETVYICSSVFRQVIDDVVQLRRNKMDLGLATLQHALADLRAGVREIAYNDGPRIREYAQVFGLVPPINWCSVAVGTWLREAADEYDFRLPIKGSPAAKTTMSQFIKAGLWTPRKGLHEGVLVPGNIVVWHRGAPGAWTGHIGIIEDRDSDSGDLLTVEGNSGPNGDKVARMRREVDNRLLLGVGRLRAEKQPPDTLTEYELAMADAWQELGAEPVCQPLCNPVTEED